MVFHGLLEECEYARVGSVRRCCADSWLSMTLHPDFLGKSGASKTFRRNPLLCSTSVWRMTPVMTPKRPWEVEGPKVYKNELWIWWNQWGQGHPQWLLKELSASMCAPGIIHISQVIQWKLFFQYSVPSSLVTVDSSQGKKYWKMGQLETSAKHCGFFVDSIILNKNYCCPTLKNLSLKCLQ